MFIAPCKKGEREGQFLCDTFKRIPKSATIIRDEDAINS